MCQGVYGTWAIYGADTLNTSTRYLSSRLRQKEAVPFFPVPRGDVFLVLCMQLHLMQMRVDEPFVAINACVFFCF